MVSNFQPCCSNSLWKTELTPIPHSNTPRSLRIKFEEVIDHATARHNAGRKIVREDSDGRRLIIELEQIVVHACWELLSCLAS
jgi:hypothetical protein